MNFLYPKNKIYSSKLYILTNYLTRKGINFEKDESRDDLYQRAKKVYERPKTLLEIKAEAQGHYVLYLPPYHPELSRIELAWGYVKKIIGEAAAYNTQLILDQILLIAFKAVTPGNARNWFRHIENFEESYMESKELRKLLQQFREIQNSECFISNPKQNKDQMIQEDEESSEIDHDSNDENSESQSEDNGSLDNSSTTNGTEISDDEECI